ncbi:MAG: hypothetical protein ACK583_01415 [Cyanobacteriota bacterium]
MTEGWLAFLARQQLGSNRRAAVRWFLDHRSPSRLCGHAEQQHPHITAAGVRPALTGPPVSVSTALALCFWPKGQVWRWAGSGGYGRKVNGFH